MSETTAKGRPLRRGERLQIMLEEEELAVIDDFRFKHRMPSRAAAVRELLRRGLLADGFHIEQANNASSSAFGVIEGAVRGSPDGADGGAG
ncbi:MAG: hypothetical protein ACTHOR_12375 [Devosia sp.]|jgi:hypothetical protein